VRRLGLVLIVVLTLSGAGASALMSWVLRQANIGVPTLGATPIVGSMALVVLIGTFLFALTMRRVGLPMGDIVAAADRVTAGDYDTRLDERGPPFLRIVARAFNRMTITLQAQDRQRRDLLADIAHELRTPLSVMQGRLEGVLDGVYDRSDAQIAEVLDETRMLARLVEDLGTLAHAERGVMGLRKEPTDAAALVDDAVQALEPEARTRQVGISSNAPADLDPVTIDPLRMREVVLNLVANGIRHSQPGAVVTVSVTQQAGELVIAVRDTGPGMSADEAAKIFDRFQKGPRSQGSGLGLAIARHLVEAHGGAIQVESTLGIGTTLTVRVPGQTG
jgi:two-component system OmpR family sensor kinase/two-component system sensor histidine kinase BaeS